MLKKVERIRRLVEALGRWPTSWRAALVTSSVEGKPLEVFRVAEPSIWPFVASVGLMIVFGSEIWSLHWLAAIGGLIFIAGLVGWHRPSPVKTSEADEQAFAREHGIPVRTSGSRTVARSGMNLFVQFFARLGEYSSSRYIAVDNTAFYFSVSAVFGLITLAVLYGIPYLS